MFFLPDFMIAGPDNYTEPCKPVISRPLVGRLLLIQEKQPLEQKNDYKNVLL